MKSHDIPKRPDRRPENAAIPETVSPASETEHELTCSRPEFIRLPRSLERCPWTGLSRGTLNDLVLGPAAPVQSVVVKQPGASRGIRLVHLQSLLDFLHARMAEQEATQAAGID